MPAPRRPLIALPSAHYMAFAPLDCWFRVLIRGGTFISPRYWARLAWCLFTSALGTAVTLPERVLLWPVLALLRRRPIDHAPGIVFVLGYYRSGTTHLHYLLSCDPRFNTPRWYQVLAPAGFVLSWQVLRWVMTPFVSSKRPQDDVAIGPEWPAEDDFAVNNWTGACTMPGRMLLPRAWERFADFNDVQAAPERDRRLFSDTLTAFVRKLALVSRGRALLLKTPAHTARVGELVQLFGRRARFIHLSRDAGAVLRSNIAMHARFAPYFLQDHPGDDVIRKRIIAEYDATERALLRDAAALPPGTLARMRYQDLVADPLDQVRRVYAELGLTLSPEAESRMAAYLRSVSDYRAAGQKGDPRESGSRGTDAPQGTRCDDTPPQLGWMREAFGHDKPAAHRAEVPPATAAARIGGELAGAAAACIAAVLCAALWLALAAATRDRSDIVIWPVGIVVGIAALRAAGAGNWRLGALAALLVLFTYLGIAFPATYLSCNDYWKRDGYPWTDVWDSTRDGVFATNNIFWAVLGIGTAYRFASRKHVKPPGM
ncbi:MAG: sulfotransferase [Phycisphaeraceae bacterium]|nr:sulfotransferase [Phycisphaeraceae bacterium]